MFKLVSVYKTNFETMKGLLTDLSTKGDAPRIVIFKQVNEVKSEKRYKKPNKKTQIKDGTFTFGFRRRIQLQHVTFCIRAMTSGIQTKKGFICRFL